MRADLRALLASYEPDDDHERMHHRRMRTLLDVPGDPFARDHFSPGHFTASAFVLSASGDALYLIHHAKLHRWLQPGGHIEPDDESVLAAARREVLEEVGLANAGLVPDFPAVFDVDVHLIPARPDEPAHEHFDVRFVFVAPTRADVCATKDVLAGRWLSLEDVTAERADESVARAARKLRRAR